MDGTDLDYEVSSYFLERLQMKRDIQNEILEEYPNDVGTTFSTYGSQIKRLYGNDVLGHVAAEALYSGEETWMYNNNSVNSPYRVGYLTRINERNLCAVIDFPEITELSISSFDKFMFWFTGTNVSAINFPNLSVLVVPDDFKYPCTWGPQIRYGSFTRFNEKLYPYKSSTYSYCKVNMPNLKYVSERLMPRPVCWKYPGTDIHTFDPYESQEVDMALSDESDSHVVESVSCVMWNQSVEKIPDDFVFHIDSNEE